MASDTSTTVADHKSGPAIDKADVAAPRWIAYISPERRVLWSEIQGDFPIVPFQDGGNAKFDIPGSTDWNHVVDAAFSTRVPQCSTKKLTLDGVSMTFTLKVFPDFSPGGHFKGVIQVIEKATGDKASSGVFNRSREVHSVLDLTMCGVALYNPEQDRILNANRRLAQETGFSVDALETMSGRDLFGPDGVAILKNIYHRMLRAGTGMIWGQMLHLNASSGKRGKYLTSLRIIPDKPAVGSDPAMMVSVDAPESDVIFGGDLRAPYPHFIAEALHDGLWELDTDSMTFHYSATFADIFGPEGLPGGPGKPFAEWEECIYQGESEKILRGWRDLLKDGARYRLQYRIKDASGEWRWILSTIHAILNDANGRPRRVIGFHSDITDAMNSDRQLADVEARLRAIFEDSGMGIVLCGKSGTIAKVNPALALMLGRDEKDFTDKWLSSFADPEFMRELRVMFQRVMHGGRRTVLQDVRFIKGNGREMVANLTATLSRKVSDGERYVIIMLEDVTDSHAKRKRLQYEATHDVLTGAWNRMVLLERLEQHLHLAQRHSLTMSFCLCDLDNFKLVNDKHGHQSGDQVLRRFVEILNESVRKTDIVGRYGGEEFGIVLPNTSVEGTALSMERAKGLLARETFVDARGVPFQVSATFGISGATPDATLKQIIYWADSALYDGKETGRNKVVAATPAFGDWL